MSSGNALVEGFLELQLTRVWRSRSLPFFIQTHPKLPTQVQLGEGYCAVIFSQQNVQILKPRWKSLDSQVEIQKLLDEHNAILDEYGLIMSQDGDFSIYFG